MNSVHLVTQEKYRVESGQKQAEFIECTAQSQPVRPGHAPSFQAACPAPRPRAQRPAPACRALRLRRAPLAPSAPRARPASAPCAPCARLPPPSPHAARPLRPAACSSRPLARPPALRAPSASTPNAQHAQRPAPACRVAATVAVSWLGWALHRNTVQPCLAPKLQYSAVYCNTLLPSSSPLLLQYNLVLQYNLALHPAIQSKTNKLYCNTISFLTIQIGQ